VPISYEVLSVWRLLAPASLLTPWRLPRVGDGEQLQRKAARLGSGAVCRGDMARFERRRESRPFMMLRVCICVELAPGRPLWASAAAAVVVGLVMTQPLYLLLERRMDPRGSSSGRGVPPWLTGIIERLVFAPAFLLVPAQAATGAFAWLTLKLAANWQQEPAEQETSDQRRDNRRRAVRALSLGLLSLAIAAACGLYFRWLCTSLSD
jgi:hypothetical protein